MNTVTILRLIEEWNALLNDKEEAFNTKINSCNNKLLTRTKRTSGEPIIFDLDMHNHQTRIQKLLCKEMPQWKNLICSSPEIMDGYTWNRRDFVELYCSHYRIVAKKLMQIVDKLNTV